MWVRTRNLTFYYDACESILVVFFSREISKKIYSGHHDPKYLGSTGFLPALQSYLCRYNNTCHNYSQTTDQFHGNASYVDCFSPSYSDYLSVFPKRFWTDLSKLGQSLSIVLNDLQSIDSLTKLSSQFNSLRNRTNIWDGKCHFVRIDLPINIHLIILKNRYDPDK